MCKILEENCHAWNRFMCRIVWQRIACILGFKLGAHLAPFNGHKREPEQRNKRKENWQRILKRCDLQTFCMWLTNLLGQFRYNSFVNFLPELCKVSENISSLLFVFTIVEFISLASSEQKVGTELFLIQTIIWGRIRQIKPILHCVQEKYSYLSSTIRDGQASYFEWANNGGITQIWSFYKNMINVKACGGLMWRLCAAILSGYTVWCPDEARIKQTEYSQRREACYHQQQSFLFVLKNQLENGRVVLRYNFMTIYWLVSGK